MAWTTPKTWTTGEPLTAGDLNTHLRDNLEALRQPPTAHYEPDETSDYSTTSGTFVDVDSTNLALTITTNGGDVLVGFHGSAGGVAGSGGMRYLQFDVEVDSERVAGDDGIVALGVPGSSTVISPISFARLVTGLAPGGHTFKLQWRRNNTGLTGTLYAGAGTSGLDVHPQFWVQEVS